MKINKWTLGLAAVGLISLGSVVKAEEAATPLLTALSSTTISGYADVSAQWNPGNNVAMIPLDFGSKKDGFNVNSALVSLEKPLAEGEWSAGYRVDLQFGPDTDSVTVGGAPGAASENLRQAYVALRAPVGNGLDLKVGRFDTIIGYESADGYKNPNYTRSYGWGIEPTEHTGVLATYQALDSLSLNLGIANTTATGPINARGFGASDSEKTYMASVAFTAPDSMGALAGSALYAGVIDGIGTAGSLASDQTSYYVGATIATPVEGLRLGVAFDFADDISPAGDAWTAAIYASFKATDKLGLHLRAERATFDAGGPAGPAGDAYAFTGTVQYDLWENVISRLEARWDSGSAVVVGGDNALMVAANLIYKF